VRKIWAKTEEDLGKDICLEHGGNLLEIQIEEVDHRAGTRVDGIVEQQIDATPFAQRSLHGRLHRGPIEQVQADRQRVAADFTHGLCRGLDAPRERAPVEALALLERTGRHDDVVAFFRKRER
jgi:hypothetical protein